MKNAPKWMAVLLIVLLAFPASLAEESHLEENWETEPWSTASVADYQKNPEKALAYFDGLIAYLAGQNNGFNGLPDAQSVPVGKALDTVLDALKKQRSETDETLATMRLTPDYVIQERWSHLDGETVLQPPLWQISLEGEDGTYYCIVMDAKTGEILELHGEEITHG